VGDPLDTLDASMPEPRLAVLIVDTNEGRYLPRCLTALREQTRPADRVLLVDNASTDGSPELVRRDFPEVEVIPLGRNAGFAAANNAGARAADDCDLIVLLNADAFAAPEWLEHLVRAAEEHPEAAAIASLMLRENERDLLDGTGDMYHVSGIAWRRDHLRPIAESPNAERGEEVFSACGGAVLYRREAYMAAGGFEEGFFCYFEDTDLAFRLRLMGHRVWYEPRAVVRHVGSGTTGVASEFSVYHSFRNMVWTWVRNMPGPLLWAYLPAHLLLNVLNVLSYARTGHAGTILRAKVDAVRGLPRVLRERKAVQARRRVGWRELRAVMATGSEILPAMPSLERLANFRR
jgi:GT2 family glycosyltransferase